MGKLKSALVATAAAVSVLAMAPAAQADVFTEGWGMSWGATQTNADILWTDGWSAYARGCLQAVSGHREVWFQGENGSEATGWIKKRATNETKCWSYDEGRMTLQIPGGVQVVRAALWADGEWVHMVHCSRSGCTRDY